MASFGENFNGLFGNGDSAGQDQLSLEGEALTADLFYDEQLNKELALSQQSDYPDLDSLNNSNSNSNAFTNLVNQTGPEPAGLALPLLPPLPLPPVAEEGSAVEPQDSVLALPASVTNSQPQELPAEPELPQQRYTAGKRVPPRGAKISHSRDKKDGRTIEDYDWYEPMPQRPAWEAGQGSGKTTIAYERTGQFKHGLRFDQTTLERYLLGCREQGISLRLWVQEAPTMHAERFQVNNHRCRSVYCEFHTISRGEYQVSFDEHPDKTSSGRYDPFHVAGYMHLFCMEKLIPMAALMGGQLADVRADLRTLPLEEKNPMSLARDDSDSLRSAFTRWVGRYVDAFRRFGLVIAHSGDFRTDCHTLRNYLTRAKILHQPEARQRKRNQRGGVDIAQHLGNLDRKAAMLEDKKERRKLEKKRKARREAVGRGSSDEDDGVAADCIEVNSSDDMADARPPKRVCTLRGTSKLPSATESRAKRQQRYQKLQRQQRQKETQPPADCFPGDYLQSPSLNGLSWVPYGGGGDPGQCVVQPVNDWSTNYGQPLPEPMPLPDTLSAYDQVYQLPASYQLPPLPLPPQIQARTTQTTQEQSHPLRYTPPAPPPEEEPHYNLRITRARRKSQEHQAHQERCSLSGNGRGDAIDIGEVIQVGDVGVVGDMGDFSDLLNQAIEQASNLDQLPESFLLDPTLFQSPEQDNILLAGNTVANQTDNNLPTTVSEQRITRSTSREKSSADRSFDPSPSAITTTVEGTGKNEAMVAFQNEVKALQTTTLDLGLPIDPALLAMNDIDPALLLMGDNTDDSNTNFNNHDPTQGLRLDLDYSGLGLDFGAAANAYPVAASSTDAENGQPDALKLPGPQLPSAEATAKEAPEDIAEKATETISEKTPKNSQKETQTETPEETSETSTPETQDTKPNLSNRVRQLEALVKQLASQLVQNGGIVLPLLPN